MFMCMTGGGWDLLDFISCVSVYTRVQSTNGEKGLQWNSW